uniref:Apple domain-containing protein n=1 Tax=Alexandrium catenella TaxID=2925 RepID=A0A7S1QRZ9_ALECA
MPSRLIAVAWLVAALAAWTAECLEEEQGIQKEANFAGRLVEYLDDTNALVQYRLDPNVSVESAEADNASAAPAKLLAEAVPPAKKFKWVQTTTAPEESFEAGERAQMRIESGAYAEMLVPCVVKGKRLNGRYHIRITTSPLSTDLFNIPGRFLVKTQEDKYTESLESLRADGEEFAHMVAQLESEATARTHTEATDRKLNGTAVSKWMSSQRIVMEREIEAEARQIGCPTGYKLVTGSARPSERVANASDADTGELCSKACVAGSGCEAFEWSPNRKTCIPCKASAAFYKKNNKDFLFCKRVK